MMEGVSNPVRIGRWSGPKSRRAWFKRVMAKHGFKQSLPFNNNPKLTRLEWCATCWWCGKFIRKREITLDHVIPVSEGGLTCVENLVPACFECNQERSKPIKKDGGENA